MDTYIFNADIYCEWCGAGICDQLDAEGKRDTGDSGDYPQGPYGDGGGEADVPQHCGECHVPLDNPLTTDGVEYILERLHETLREPKVERDRIMPKPGTGEDEPGFRKTWAGKRHVEITRGWAEQVKDYRLPDDPQGSMPSERRPARFVELFLQFTAEGP